MSKKSKNEIVSSSVNPARCFFPRMEKQSFASRLDDRYQRSIIETWIGRMKEAEKHARARGEEPGPAVIFEDRDGIRWGSLDVNDPLEVSLLRP